MLTTVAGVIVLMLVVSYGLWRAAQEGIGRTEEELVNAVRLETIEAQHVQPEQHERTKVEIIELLDGKAMVQALITRTETSGQVVVYPKIFFYAQTPHGWQRTTPVSIFWGETQVLDTSHLHFVSGGRDRAAVVQLAPGAELLYTALSRALGRGPTGADGRLTIEIAPEYVLPDEAVVDGRMRLTSPRLYDLSFGYTAEELLAHFTRKAMAKRMFEAARNKIPLKSQWRPMTDVLQFWLTSSPTLPLAPPVRQTACPLPTVQYGYPPFNDLHAQGLWLAPSNLIDYIVAVHGLDMLPGLLRGFGKHEEWEALAPAVLGVSAAELEAGWYTWQNSAKPPLSCP